MTPPRLLTAPRLAYRIGDAAGAYPVYSAEGAKEYPGRWNQRAEAMIYASEHYSTAVLEKLVRIGAMPADQHFVEITIPEATSYEVVTADRLPDWHQPNRAASRAFGSVWLSERRSAILIVPSVVARMERNILINPDHPDSRRISAGLEIPIWWDERLFSR